MPVDADVVILSLDRPEETEAAIRSALAQTGIERQVIVVDQGSARDNLTRLRASFGDNPDVRLIALGRNLGVPGGRAIGNDAGTGRVIVSLDNDAVFGAPDTLSRILTVLDADRSLGAIGLRILVDATGADDWSSWGYPVALRARAAECFDAVTFVGAGHAIRRTAWQEAGGYDPALFFCWEELDFSLRAIARGWRIGYRGDIAVRHRVSPERRVAWGEARWFHHVRNRMLVARKWATPWPALLARGAGYLVKGARHGLLPQTAHALIAAARMPVPAAALPPDARAYIAANDRAHRGGPVARLRREVLAPLSSPA